MAAGVPAPSTVPVKAMSTTTPTQETVSTDVPTTDNKGLATIVAQTLPFGDDLPNFEEVRWAGWAVKDSIERVAAEELEDAD